MKSCKISLLVILLSIFFFCKGCKAPAEKIVTSSPGIVEDKTAWAKPSWGQQSEGLQCRLRPDRRIWQHKEQPSFKIDIRNRGKRIFAFFPFHQIQLCRIQFDGKWHQWPSPFMIDSPVWPLAPGAQFDNITFTLHERFKINLTPGKHIVRIRFTLEGIEVESNPVGIEILLPSRKRT